MSIIVTVCVCVYIAYVLSVHNVYPLLITLGTVYLSCVCVCECVHTHVCMHVCMSLCVCLYNVYQCMYTSMSSDISAIQ